MSVFIVSTHKGIVLSSSCAYRTKSDGWAAARSAESQGGLDRPASQLPSSGSPFEWSLVSVESKSPSRHSYPTLIDSLSPRRQEVEEKNLLSFFLFVSLL